MMVRPFFFLLTCLSYCLLHVGFLSAQTPASLSYDRLIREEDHKRYVRYLTHPLAEGRAAGTTGNEYVRQMILSQFRQFGLEPYRGSYTQSFRVDSLIGRNITGFIPSGGQTDEYIIVGAHYDHLGILQGRFYPGADDNASGVAALLNLARVFAQIKRERGSLSRNILFIAFDAKEFDMAGSRYFTEHMHLDPRRIACMINIDQIGSTLAPPAENPAYILVLGRETLRRTDAPKIERASLSAGSRLDIDYTFYRSPDFYRIFYRLSDHYPFAKKNIPALLFTSGITDRTYKTTDLEASVSYPVLTERTRLIFHLICEFMR